MRVANYRNRLSLVTGDTVVDVSRASGERFDADPALVYDRWPEFKEWAASVTGPGEPFDQRDLGPPSPRPRQVFGIGMNYAAHAAEGGIDLPEFPSVFTKFPSSIAGQHATVALPSAFVDWEVELVAVIGAEAYHVPAEEGWDHVAGLTVGQDLSERMVQIRPPLPQFNLGKSFQQFGPTGPWLVTPDDVPDRDDLPLECSLNGEQMQASHTGDLIFSVPALVHHLSSIVTLYPGDLIFTGTPSGVGFARDPKRFIAAGDELVSVVEGIGTLVTHFADHTESPRE